MDVGGDWIDHTLCVLLHATQLQVFTCLNASLRKSHCLALASPIRIGLRYLSAMISATDSESLHLIQRLRVLKDLTLTFSSTRPPICDALKPLDMPSVVNATLIWIGQWDQAAANYIFSCRFRFAQVVDLQFPELAAELALGFREFLADFTGALLRLTLHCRPEVISVVKEHIFRCADTLQFNFMSPPADIISPKCWQSSRIVHMTLMTQLHGNQLWPFLTAMCNGPRSSRPIFVRILLVDPRFPEFRWTATHSDTGYSQFVGRASQFALNLHPKNIVITDVTGRGLGLLSTPFVAPS
jgi:hypothetical protein